MPCPSRTKLRGYTYQYRLLHTLYDSLISCTVLGDEPRPAVYLSGEDALRVGLTASERAELDRERWEATGAALTEEQRIVRDLTRAEIRRRKDRA